VADVSEKRAVFNFNPELQPQLQPKRTKKHSSPEDGNNSLLRNINFANHWTHVDYDGEQWRTFVSTEMKS
jgi:hypothetical protein